jgi:hypothetical protein
MPASIIGTVQKGMKQPGSAEIKGCVLPIEYMPIDEQTEGKRVCVTSTESVGFIASTMSDSYQQYVMPLVAPYSKLKTYSANPEHSQAHHSFSVSEEQKAIKTLTLGPMAQANYLSRQWSKKLMPAGGYGHGPAYSLVSIPQQTQKRLKKRKDASKWLQIRPPSRTLPQASLNHSIPPVCQTITLSRQDDFDDNPILNIPFEELSQSNEPKRERGTQVEARAKSPRLCSTETVYSSTDSKSLQLQQPSVHERQQDGNEYFQQQREISDIFQRSASGTSSHAQLIHHSRSTPSLKQTGHSVQAGAHALTPESNHKTRATSDRVANRVTKHQPTKPGQRAEHAAANTSLNKGSASRGVFSSSQIFSLLELTILQEGKKALEQECARTEVFEREVRELKQSQANLQLQLDITKKEKDELILKTKQDSEKLGSYAEKASTFQKFINGLNSDLDKEKKRAKDLNQQVLALAEEGRITREECKTIKESLSCAIQCSADGQKKLFRECASAEMIIQKLEHLKASLGKELSNTSQRLIEETNRRMKLEEHISKQSMEQISTAKSSKENHHELLQKLTQIEVAMLPINCAATSVQLDGLAKQMHDLHSRQSASPEDVKRLESLVAGLESW